MNTARKPAAHAWLRAALLAYPGDVVWLRTVRAMAPPGTTNAALYAALNDEDALPYTPQRRTTLVVPYGLLWTLCRHGYWNRCTLLTVVQAANNARAAYELLG